MTSMLEDAAVPDWLGEARHRGLLARLPASAVAGLVRNGQRVEYAAGATLLRWDDGPKTAIVLSGTLRSYLAGPDGGQVTTRYLRAGDVTGSYPPLQPSLDRGVEAIVPGELLIVDSVHVRDVALLDSRVAWAFVEELTTILNSIQRGLFIRAFGSVRKRVVSALVDRAHATRELRVGGRLTGTQSNLAVEIGSVREVVAAVLRDLKCEGIIEVQRGLVVIRDPRRLINEAGAAFGFALAD